MTDVALHIGNVNPENVGIGSYRYVINSILWCEVRVEIWG